MINQPRPDVAVSLFSLPLEVNDIILNLSERLTRFLLVNFVSKSLFRLARSEHKKRLREITKGDFSLESLVEKRFALFEWAVHQNCPVNSSFILEELARNEQFELLKMVQPKCLCWPSVSVSCAAARSGRLEILEWLYSNGFPLNIHCSDRPPTVLNDCSMAAASEGHLHILKWMKKICHVSDVFHFSTWRAAVRAGHLPILKWFNSSRGLKWACLFSDAIQSGDMATLKWLERNHCFSIDDSLCDVAASQGNIPALEWIINHYPSSPWNGRTCQNAASSGHFECLKWLRQKGCPVNPYVIHDVTHRGSLEMFQWCVNYDSLPYDSALLEIMAARGRLELLKWVLLECQWPWREDICYMHHFGHSEVIEWARENHLPFDETKCGLSDG